MRSCLGHMYAKVVLTVNMFRLVGGARSAGRLFPKQFPHSIKYDLLHFIRFKDFSPFLFLHIGFHRITLIFRREEIFEVCFRNRGRSVAFTLRPRYSIDYLVRLAHGWLNEHISGGGSLPGPSSGWSLSSPCLCRQPSSPLTSRILHGEQR